jgi:hypothetical protein
MVGCCSPSVRCWNEQEFWTEFLRGPEFPAYVLAASCIARGA